MTTKLEILDSDGEVKFAKNYQQPCAKTIQRYLLLLFQFLMVGRSLYGKEKEIHVLHQ